MLKLVHNEWVKYFNRMSTYIMLGLIVALLIFITVMNMQFPSSLDDTRTYSADNWKSEVKADLAKYTKQHDQLMKKQDKNMNIEDSTTVYQLESEIPRLQYYLDKDVQPPAIHNFFTDLISTSSLMNLVVIMVVVITSSLMSREHQQGTIKLLLIRPASRIKIFFSKWLLAVITAVIFTLFIYGVNAMIAAITAPMNPGSKLAVMNTTTMKYKMVDFWPYFMKFLFNDLVYVIIFATIAYLLSVLFRNTAMALGVTLGLVFFSGLITGFFSSKTELTKYLWSSNWSLNNYMGYLGEPAIKGMTYEFSLIYNVIALIVVIGITAFIFKRRDVAN